MAIYQQPCAHCGGLVQRDARVCPRCASRHPFGFLCPACLRPVGRDDRLCSGCGRPLVCACPFCGAAAFAPAERCEACGQALTVVCENKRCGQRQFFENAKCTVCGHRIKRAAAHIDQRKRGR
jgi:hypothetical protein